MTSAAVSGGATVGYAWDVDSSLPQLLYDGTRYYLYGLDLLYSINPRGFSAPAAARPKATATSTPHTAAAPRAATTPKGTSTTTPDNLFSYLRVYHTDGLGSVRALTGDNGTLLDTYQTDAFGADAGQVGRSQQPLGYAGQQTDTDGLVYLRARYYDPNSGRFMSRDPMAGSAALPLSLNRYDYVLNNPMPFTDASDLSSKAPDDGLGDDPCHSTARGKLAGYLTNAACTAFVALGQGAVRVKSPRGTFILPVSFAAAPPPGGGKDPSAGQETSERAARRAAREELCMTIGIYSGETTPEREGALLHDWPQELEWSLWTCPQSGTSLSEVDLTVLARAFEPMRAVVWHSSSGTSSSSRVRDYKRAFGDWPSLARHVVARDTRQFDADEPSIYSDVVLLAEGGYGDLARLLNLTTAGANCAIAFLQAGAGSVYPWSRLAGGLAWLWDCCRSAALPRPLPGADTVLGRYVAWTARMGGVAALVIMGDDSRRALMFPGRREMVEPVAKRLVSQSVPISASELDRWLRLAHLVMAR